MGDVFSWLIGNWGMLVTTLLAVIGGASVMVHAVAPLTKSKKDDKAAAWLDKVAGWLGAVASKVALNPKPKE